MSNGGPFMRVIHGKSLSTFKVAPDGCSVSINVVDEDARQGSLVLSADCLGALIMTLPEMMRQSLCRRYRDASLRFAYPVSDWEIEAAAEAPESVILTLRTPDGFQVSFVLPKLDLRHMIANGLNPLTKPH